MANLTVEVNFHLPQAVLDFCAAAAGRFTTPPVPAKAATQDIIPAKPSTAPKAEAKAKASKPQLTLTDVRSALAPLLKAGRKEEVQGLFQKYGVTKLSEVDPENYASLMKDAEAL